MSVHIGCRTELQDLCTSFFLPIWMRFGCVYQCESLLYNIIEISYSILLFQIHNCNYKFKSCCCPSALEDSARKLNSLGLKAPNDVQPNLWDLSELSSGKFREIELSLNNIFLFLAGYRWEQLVPGMFISQGSNCWMNITPGLYEIWQNCQGCLFYW